MVDGSNESWYYPDEELDPNLWKGIPLQKSFEKVDVVRADSFILRDADKLPRTRVAEPENLAHDQVQREQSC